MSNANQPGLLRRALRRFAKILLGLALALVLIAGGLKLWLRVAHAPPIAPAQAVPADFIWGVSSSAFQSEGGDVDSNMLRMNQKAVGDRKHPEDPYGSSVDFRHRYREDIALARGLGVNTYRIGINWARVEPRQGQIDQAELAYYDDLINALTEAGIPAPHHPGPFRTPGLGGGPGRLVESADGRRVPLLRPPHRRPLSFGRALVADFPTRPRVLHRSATWCESAPWAGAKRRPSAAT